MNQGYDDNPHKQLNIALDYLVLLSNDNLEELKSKIYNSVTALSYLAIEGNKADFKSGWAGKLLDSEGHPFFTGDEANTVEFISLNTVLPLFNETKQEGGAFPVPRIPIPVTGHGTMNPDEESLSLDELFNKIKDFISKMDKESKRLGQEVGPYKLFYNIETKSIPIPLPFPPGKIDIPPPVIPVLISLFVESIRLLFSFGPLSSDITRKVLSIVVAITDILQGDWKQGILSLIGYFGTSPLLIGIIGKIFLNVFSTFAPELQTEIVDVTFKSSKSFIIGIILWITKTFAPDGIRVTMNKEFNKIKQMAMDANKFLPNKIPIDSLPTLTTIQSLQTLASLPFIVCSTEFQDSIKPLIKIQAARLLLELVNIPTTEITLKQKCGRKGILPLNELMKAAALAPGGKPVSQTPITLKGGKRKKRHYTKKASRS